MYFHEVDDPQRFFAHEITRSKLGYPSVHYELVMTKSSL